MLLPTHLRVIGSRRIFQYFLPPDRAPFVTSEFIHVLPSQNPGLFSSLVSDDTLTVVVNPDDYSVEEMSSVPGPVWLWFLRRLFWDGNEIRGEAPSLVNTAEQSSESRRAFLSSLNLGTSSLIVVSDSESLRYCLEKGVSAVLSPPPISDSLTHTREVSAKSATFSTFSEPTEYSRLFFDSLQVRAPNVGRGSAGSRRDLGVTTHAIAIAESIDGLFSYEAAVSLGASHTLISGPLSPLWGLEPGIDYIEYSTPEELIRIVEHSVRNPLSTRLLSKRGAAKARFFLSSRIFQRLLDHSNSVSP